MSQTITREVQITRDEFLRQLPPAIGGRDFHVSNGIVTVKDGDRSVIINVESLGTKELGELDLPMQKIEFDFRGFTDKEVEDFMTSYDEHKLRGMGGM